MPSNTNESNISGLFSELKKLENNGEYEQSMKIVSKILHIKPDHRKALHCKIVCLIQLNRFEEALKLIDELNQKNDEQSRGHHFKLEKCYCKYRLNNIEDALRDLNEPNYKSDDEFGLNELKAQALYRLENFNDCFSNYVDLIKNSHDFYEEERYVNLTAVIAGLKSLDKNFQYEMESISDSTYEVIYNKACTLIASEHYSEAIKKLSEAEVACRKFFEEDGCQEEEIEAELAIIRAQNAYCQQKLDKNEMALRNYNQILKQKLSDPALISVVCNNIVAIHKDKNLFDSKKKIKMALNEASETKLSVKQKRNLFYNYCLFLISTNQFDLFHKYLESFRTKFPDEVCDTYLIEAYRFYKEKNLSGAYEILKRFTEINENSQPQSSEIEVYLFLVQLLLQQSKYEECAEILKNLCNVSPRLAIISLLFQIYEKTSNHSALEKLIDNFLMRKENQSNPSVIPLLNEAARFYQNHDKPKLAVQCLEKIVRLKGKTPKLISLLINSYSLFDPAKAKSLQAELPSIEQILNSVDIDQLENKNWSLGIKYVKKSKDTPKTTTVGKKIVKRKRKKILPKNYNPDAIPDPERWLPKYERSNYRKKKDKKAIGKGTQGAVGEVPEIKASPKQIVAPVGPRQQRPTQKKKKKTGRK
ncbi:natriuretic peptides receptor [Sarcoptes scabiei]|nr:natriuretic peptides receptor [Sarcoptes scabiei]